MKKKHYIIGGIVLSIILLFAIIFLLLFDINPNSKIKSSKLNKEVEVPGNIVYKEDELILVGNENDIYFLEYNNDEVSFDKIENRDKELKYKVVEESDSFYLLDTKSNDKVLSFDSYLDITNNDKITHYLLYTKSGLTIFDVSTGKSIELNKNIKKFDNMYTIDGKLKSNSYIIVSNEQGLHGLIDYSGKQVLDFKYDYIDPVDSSNKFIVEYNGKVGLIDNNNEKIIDFKYDMLFEYDNKFVSIINGKYGIIDSKGNEVLEHNYDNAIINNDHVLLIVNGLYGAFTDKLVMKPSVILNTDLDISSYMFNNKLHLISYDKTYVIENFSKVDEYDDELLPVLLEGQNNYCDKYLYSVNRDEKSYKYKIYNSNYKEHYSFDIEVDNSSSEYFNKTDISYINDKQYNINIKKYDSKNYSKISELTYSYNFDKKKKLDINDVQKNSFENGIEYIIDKNNNLTIYNKDKVIGEYKDIMYNVGGYYFIDKNAVIFKLDLINE